MMMTSCLITTNGNGKTTVATGSGYDNQYDCTNGHKIYYPPSGGSGSPEADTRIIRLRRIGNSPLGFSIRGGKFILTMSII